MGAFIELAHPKQIGSVCHSFLSLYGFSATNTCDVSMSIICHSCDIHYDAVLVLYAVFNISDAVTTIVIIM